MDQDDGGADGGAPEPSGHGDHDVDADTASTNTEVVVYWRPGCPFCRRLLRWLDRNAATVQRRNIWEDPDAAATVRAITGGDETVPTVTVGDRHLVNPSPRALSATLSSQAPWALPTSTAAHDGAGRGWFRRWRS